MICTYYTLLDAPEFSLSYHVGEILIAQYLPDKRIKNLFFHFYFSIQDISLIIDGTYL